MSDVTLQSESANKKQRNTKIWLVITQVIAGVIMIRGIFSTVESIYSVYSHPEYFGGEVPSGIYALGIFEVVQLFIYPLLTIVPAISAWRLFAKRQYRRAAIVTCIPIAALILGYLLFAILFTIVYTTAH